MEPTSPEIATAPVVQNLTQSHYVVNAPTTSEKVPKRTITVKKKQEIIIPPKKRGRKKKNQDDIDIKPEISYIPPLYKDNNPYLDEDDELYDDDQLYDDELYDEDDFDESFNRHDEHMEQIVNVLIDIKRSIDINSQCLLKLLTEMTR